MLAAHGYDAEAYLEARQNKKIEPYIPSKTLVRLHPPLSGAIMWAPQYREQLRSAQELVQLRDALWKVPEGLPVNLPTDRRCHVVILNQSPALKVDFTKNRVLSNPPKNARTEPISATRSLKFPVRRFRPLFVQAWQFGVAGAGFRHGKISSPTLSYHHLK